MAQRVSLKRRTEVGSGAGILEERAVSDRGVEDIRGDERGEIGGGD